MTHTTQLSARARGRLGQLSSKPFFERVLDYAIAISGGLWIAMIFFAFAWAGWRGTFSIVAAAEPQLSADTSWLPLSAEVARGNFFPLTPSLGNGASGLSFYPYLSIWLYGLFIALFGPAGAGAVGQVFWPAIAFFLMWAIYRLYLPRRWSLVLAAMGLVVFVPLPLREFVEGLVKGEGWRSMSIPAPPDSAGFPFPSFSLAAFLLCFFLSEQRRHLSDRRLTFITFLWALQSQVHLVNAMVGLIFWFTRFPQMVHRQRPELLKSRLLAVVAVQAVLALIVVLPAILGWSSMRGGEYAFLGQGREVNPGLVGRYFYFAYFVVPLAIMLVLYHIIRIDWFELFARFWPVYLLMAVEFLLVTGNLWLGIGVSAESIFSRLGVFFLHLFYFVPITYYLTRANAVTPAGVYHGGTESHLLAVGIRSSLQWIFNEASKVYLPILFVLLTFYASASVLKVREFANGKIGIGALEARAALATLTQGARPGSLLVSDVPGVNLMLPVEGRFATLWVSRFANDISTDDVVGRLALYARLVGWTESEFLAFMAPDMPPAPEPVDLTRGEIPRGVGYWLAFHRTELDGDASLAAYQERMRVIFAAIDPVRDAAARGVDRILSRGQLPAAMVAAEVRETPEGVLYLLEP